MKILCIGDSLTYGYMVPEEEKWTHLFNKESDIEIINRGVLGDSTAGMIMRLYSEIMRSRPDRVFIMGGSNDFLMGRSLNSVINNIKILIKEAKTFDIKIIVGIQPPIIPHLAEKLWAHGVDYEKINENINEYGKWIKCYSQSENFTYVDFFHEFMRNIHLNDLEKYYIDGLHLNPAGHNVMFRKVVESFLSIDK